MSTTSKSPRTVAVVALDVGTWTLPTYSHRCSRKDYTLPQLFACLVLRKFFKTDYRGIAAIVADWRDLRETLGLTKTPHFTTFQKVEKKLLRNQQVRAMLTRCAEIYYGLAPPDEQTPREAQPITLTAADSTGFALDRASRYFVRRRAHGQKHAANPLYQSTTYRRFGKLGIVIDCDSHLILASHRGMGPKPDVNQLLPMLEAISENVIPECMLLDAGYDSQDNHELLREYLNVESWIPPTHGRPSARLPTGKWRWLMATQFDEGRYGQRWQCETAMFMIKQRQGAALTARKYQTRRREMGLMCVVHNIMIIYVWGGFLQGSNDPFSALNSIDRSGLNGLDSWGGALQWGEKHSAA